MTAMLWLAACTQATDTGSSSVEADSGSAAEAGTYESAEVCAECHERQYDEWRQSMHAYAALSPVFDAMTAKAYRDRAGEIGTFCTGCHTPQGTAAGEPGYYTAAERSETSKEGITCDVCHTATASHTTTANANLVNDLGGPKLGPYGDPSDAGHPAAQGDFISEPRLCGSCHDVFMFPGLRIEEAFTEYAESPAAEAGTTCQDCHMGPEPGVAAERSWGPSAVVSGEEYPDRELTSHRFVGPDYSLLEDFPYPDDLERSAAAQEEYAGQIQTLLENAVELSAVDIALDGEQLQLTAFVRSLTNGHRVPTGFTSERQLWLHVEAVDRATGDVLYESGDLDSYGDLRDSHSWEVITGDVALDEDLVNYQSKNMAYARDYREDGTFDEANEDQDAAQEVEEVVFPFDANYISKQSIEPLEERQHEFLLGTWDGTSTIDVTVELKYRNLPPYVLRALELEQHIEKLRTFTIGSATSSYP